MSTTNIDPVTLTEELLYALCNASAELQSLVPNGKFPGHIRMFPHPAPEDTKAPYITHDIATDETSAMPIGGRPGLFTIGWWVAVWSDQVSRQALRPIVLAVQAALVGDELRGKQIAFASDDGTAWQATIRRVGAMPAPGGVDVGSAYHRVMVRYDIELLNAS